MVNPLVVQVAVPPLSDTDVQPGIELPPSRTNVTVPVAGFPSNVFTWAENVTSEPKY
jgi:hypothetical protein